MELHSKTLDMPYDFVVIPMDIFTTQDFFIVSSTTNHRKSKELKLKCIYYYNNSRVVIRKNIQEYGDIW